MNVSSRLLPNEPVKMLGSVEASKTNWPGSAQNSTTLPCSTILSTARPHGNDGAVGDDVVAAFVLELRPETRFWPLTASTSGDNASQ